MRPDICRIALQYERNFKTHFSWEEFCEVNQRCCTILQVREQIRQQELAEERRNQAIRDACENIAWQFKTELTRVVNENIQSNFSRVNDKLSEIREGLSASQQELSTDRAEIVHALETLKVYV
jgi:DNA anti-recombination protein RmuC